MATATQAPSTTLAGRVDKRRRRAAIIQAARAPVRNDVAALCHPPQDDCLRREVVVAARSAALIEEVVLARVGARGRALVKVVAGGATRAVAKPVEVDRSAHLAGQSDGNHAGRRRLLAADAAKLVARNLAEQAGVDEVGGGLGVGKRVSQPLGAAAAHVAPRLVADDGEQRILRHAAHVWVTAVAVRRREPEAGVVRQVAVPLHREHAPRRPRADVRDPGWLVAMRCCLAARGHRAVGRQVDAHHRVVRVDLRTVARPEQVAARADYRTRAVEATRWISQATQHAQRRGAVRSTAERAKPVRRVLLAELCDRGALNKGGPAGGRSAAGTTAGSGEAGAGAVLEVTGRGHSCRLT
mmetsp:Transcript_23479/g.71287  ORF Transcript_23479/g.71287 Transcript_23479/m.71287 type:complete len:355 (-) Transcript_23479:8-1072(-)